MVFLSVVKDLKPDSSTSLGSVSKVGDYAKIWDNLKRKKALSLTPLS